MTAAYVINRVPSKVLNNRSLFQCLTDFYLDLKLHSPLPLKVVGCVCFVHIPKIYRDKLDPRAKRCVFIKYSPTQKGYMCYNLASRKIYISKYVTFIESQPFLDSHPKGRIINLDSMVSFPETTTDFVHLLLKPSQPSSPQFTPSTASSLHLTELEQTNQQLHSFDRYKGSPYVYKRRQPSDGP